MPRKGTPRGTLKGTLKGAQKLPYYQKLSGQSGPHFRKCDTRRIFANGKRQLKFLGKNDRRYQKRNGFWFFLFLLSLVVLPLSKKTKRGRKNNLICESVNARNTKVSSRDTKSTKYGVGACVYVGCSVLPHVVDGVGFR